MTDGNPNSADEFMRLHAECQSRLSSFVHALVPSWHDAEEIFQATSVVLWKKFDEFDPDTSYFSWAAKIAQYEVLNYRRASQRQRSRMLSEDVLESLASEAITSLDDLSLRQEAVEVCVSELEERDRQILKSRYQEGGTIREVADLIERSTGHARRVVQRIRAQVLKCAEARLAKLGV